MSHYKIITDNAKLMDFIAWLPELLPHEVYYLCLFGRHKYDANFPNTRDSGQLARVTARHKAELYEKIWRLETPLGSYSRDGAVASQECLAVYISINPKSLIKANQAILVEVATRFSNSDVYFNPITLCNTQIHHGCDRKFVVDFDFDGVTVAVLPQIASILPNPAMYRVLATRGGFHLLVMLDKVRELRSNWYTAITTMPFCDAKGSKSLTPVPGCVQGGFTPYFI